MNIIKIILSIFILSACSDQPWNNPYSGDATAKVLYSAFSSRPKHMDPARSYSSDEYAIIGQIYEPPLQYHFLKRPYELEPLVLTQMPTVQYFNEKDETVDLNSGKVAYTLYELDIKQGIQFQNHPAFVKNDQQQPYYLNLSSEDVEDIYQLSDFEKTATRELTADDFIYQIKRLANPRFHSPILGLMSEYIDGLSELSKELKDVVAKTDKEKWIDLNDYTLTGVTKISDYKFTIRVKGLYPQFQYWLSMPFFAPMPFEAERFYHQEVLIEKNIVLDWYPVGTGAFKLAVNNPNKQMILVKNENFRHVEYPHEGMPIDKETGLLDDAGKKLPFLDKVVYSLEKESIPYWNKFLQGYYDNSGVSSNSFDQVINMSGNGEVSLTDEMLEQGISLKTSFAPSSYYFGFNMLDDVVGGNKKSSRKLRQAIAIAVDYEEYISIFANGRGLSAQSPLPPGIFGYQEGEAGLNPVVYDWIDGKAVRKPISEAKKLLKEAGYENGIDKKTGKGLILYLDTTGSGPGSKARIAWWRKQFEKIDIQLVIRRTDYNRFQSKMKEGTAQLFQWGWNADYPDPENFLFLLYGPNGKVKTQGENAANYANPKFDALFEKLKDMPNSPERLEVINKALSILQNDSPWLWGLHPKGFTLHHDWYFNAKPNSMSHNTLMYKRVDPEKRLQRQNEWNQPVIWPIVLIAIILFLSLIPAWKSWKRSETSSIRGTS